MIKLKNMAKMNPSKTTKSIKLMLRNAVVILFALLLIISTKSFTQITWERIEVPDDSINVRTVVVDSSGTIYIGTAPIAVHNHPDFHGVYKSVDNGISWIPKGLLDTNINALTISANGDLYAGSSRKVLKSENGGDNWDLVGNCGLGNIIDILVHNNDTVYASGWVGIIRSFDGCNTWDTITDFTTDEVVSDICFDNSLNILYGKISYFNNDGGIFLSSDWGETWTKILNTDIISLSVNSNNEIFATTQLEGVYKSSDTGQTWDTIFFGVRDLWSIVINDADYIYIGCEQYFDPYGGVYASYDNGYSWIEENEGLTNEKVDLLYLDPFGFLYSIYQQDNVNGKFFRSTQTTVGYEYTEATNQEKLIIYPNPFLETTQISFNGELDKNYDLKVFNSLGQNVFKKSLKAVDGSFQCNLNLTNNPSGLYLVVLHSENEMVTGAKIIKE